MSHFIKILLIKAFSKCTVCLWCLHFSVLTPNDSELLLKTVKLEKSKANENKQTKKSMWLTLQLPKLIFPWTICYSLIWVRIWVSDILCNFKIVHLEICKQIKLFFLFISLTATVTEITHQHKSSGVDKWWKCTNPMYSVL